MSYEDQDTSRESLLAWRNLDRRKLLSDLVESFRAQSPEVIRRIVGGGPVIAEISPHRLTFSGYRRTEIPREEVLLEDGLSVPEGIAKACWEMEMLVTDLVEALNGVGKLQHFHSVFCVYSSSEEEEDASSDPAFFLIESVFSVLTSNGKGEDPTFFETIAVVDFGVKMDGVTNPELSFSSVEGPYQIQTVPVPGLLSS